MILKKIARILIYFIIITHLFACGNSKNILNTNMPYYAISITSYEKLKNDYIDLDVKIPKIIYRSTKSNIFIESVNKQIEDEITSFIDAIKSNAKDDYSNYLKSIKSIEIQFDENLIASNSNSNELSTNISNTKIDDFESNATNSNVKKQAVKSEFSKNNRDDSIKNNAVVGFTSTNDILIPGLHNKNIIIVETTAKTETDETNKTDETKRSNEANKTDETRKANKTNKNNETKNSKRQNKNIIQSEDDDFSNSKTIDSKSNNSNNYNSYTYSTLNCNYNIFCLDEEYISLNVEVSIYGKQNELKNFFYNIDLKNEKILSLKELIGNEGNIDDESSFFINSNHLPVIVNENETLVVMPITKK